MGAAKEHWLRPDDGALTENRYAAIGSMLLPTVMNWVDEPATSVNTVGDERDRRWVTFPSSVFASQDTFVLLRTKGETTILPWRPADSSGGQHPLSNEVVNVDRADMAESRSA